MEVERINDDTVRVKFNNSDLIDRGISFLDLIANKDESENFFYGILEEIELYDDFKDSDALTFQVIPKKNGLEIFISKGNNVDHETIHELAHGNYDPDDGFDVQEVIGDLGLRLATDDDSEYRPWTTVVFSNIEEILLAAQSVDTEFLNSRLYHYEGQYYLNVDLLDSEEQTDVYQDLLFSKLEEFGEKTNLSKEVLEEHGKVVIENLALETLDHYFSE